MPGLGCSRCSLWARRCSRSSLTGNWRVQSGAVIRDNHRSLVYFREIDSLLVAPATAATALHLRTLAHLERTNVTEAGERQLAARLDSAISAYCAAPTPKVLHALRTTLNDLARVNLAGLVRRQTELDRMASRTTNYLAIAATLAAMLAFGALFVFPPAILEPIAALTERILAVANGNYNQEVATVRNDEIGRITRAFNGMVAQLKRFRESELAQVLFERQRTATLMNVVADGFVVLNDRQQVIEMNPVAKTILGLAGDERNAPLPHPVPGNGQPLAGMHDVELLQRILAAPPGGGPPVVVALQGEMRTFIPMRHTMYGIDPRDGEPKALGYALHLRDVTDAHRLAEARGEFLANVSHELKTPLSSIALSLEVLQHPRQQALTEEQGQLVDEIREATARMSRLVHDVLAMAEANTRQLPLHMAPIVAMEVLEGLKAMFARHAADAGLELHVVAPPHLTTLHADNDKLLWALSNVLANAMRYAPAGSTVVLSAEVRGTGVALSIHDDGPGIAPAERAALFARGQTGAGGQSGLGLAIARALIEQMGGALYLDETAPTGATFVAVFSGGA